MPTDAVLYPILAAAVAMAAGFALLLRKLASRHAHAGPSCEWLEDFSPESYAPMERLLDEQDFVFLARQPGYEPGIARRLRAERKAIFRGYLARLVRDFNQLLGLAKLMVVFAEKDRSEFATALWRQQATFYWAICILEIRLALYPMLLGTWNIQGLLETMQRLHSEVLQRAAATVPEVA